MNCKLPFSEITQLERYCCHTLSFQFSQIQFQSSSLEKNYEKWRLKEKDFALIPIAK
jgi:hypothetical protein